MSEGDDITVGHIEDSSGVAIGREAEASVATTPGTPPPAQAEPTRAQKQRPIKSAWANGLFYVFAFVVVIAALGFLANSVSGPALIVIIMAGLLFVPLIGALQLRQDENLSQKNFMELVRLVIEQLPLIGKLFRKN
ncbi:MAG: hypothetical protein L0322_02530 [Chloroflexi bacterium]|nr:hypothetical protein [Chloroflexota bacterium]MCI0574742.1 hypothetical protein [Chloroflexota bacterium]MCI0645689.1 hypothetical protein [Chloroflexota bacterium]